MPRGPDRPPTPSVLDDPTRPPFLDIRALRFPSSPAPWSTLPRWRAPTRAPLPAGVKTGVRWLPALRWKAPGGRCPASSETPARGSSIWTPSRITRGAVPCAEIGQASLDHYIDLENIPRRRARRTGPVGLSQAPLDAGFDGPNGTRASSVPDRGVVSAPGSEWVLWRAETDPQRKGGSATHRERRRRPRPLRHRRVQPTPRHRPPQWMNADAPTPNGYTTKDDFHWRFECTSSGPRPLRSRAPASRRSPVSSGHAGPPSWPRSRSLSTLGGTAVPPRGGRRLRPRRTPTSRTRDFAPAAWPPGHGLGVWWSTWLESATARDRHRPARAFRPDARPRFGHCAWPSDDGVAVLGSYRPSQQNIVHRYAHGAHVRRGMGPGTNPRFLLTFETTRP